MKMALLVGGGGCGVTIAHAIGEASAITNIVNRICALLKKNGHWSSISEFDLDDVRMAVGAYCQTKRSRLYGGSSTG